MNPLLLTSGLAWQLGLFLWEKIAVVQAAGGEDNIYMGHMFALGVQVARLMALNFIPQIYHQSGEKSLQVPAAQYTLRHAKQTSGVPR